MFKHIFKFKSIVLNMASKMTILKGIIDIHRENIIYQFINYSSKNKNEILKYDNLIITWILFL